MNTRILSACLALILSISMAQAQTGLELKIYTSGGQGFSVNSAIVYGEHEAILIDPQFLLSEAHRVAALILESGRELKTVYVTHPHPDHYFGLAVIQDAFPDARLVALPEVVDGIREGWMARYNFWQDTYGRNLPQSGPILPEKLDGNTLELEGHTLELIGPVTGDGPNNTFVWIPALKAVVAGDIIFSGVHFIVPAEHAAWDTTIDRIAALEPVIVVPGHQVPGAPQDATTLTFMQTYMQDFEEAVAASESAQELQQKMQALYPDLGLETLLNIGTGIAFPSE